VTLGYSQRSPCMFLLGPENSSGHKATIKQGNSIPAKY
jgi:hypothetical protein